MLNELMQELSDDESGAETGTDDNAERSMWAPSAPKDAEKPWLKEFNGYLYDVEDLGGWSIVWWWGVSALLTPVAKAINSITAQCNLLSCVGILCTRLSANYGIISLQWKGFLIGWYYN